MVRIPRGGHIPDEGGETPHIPSERELRKLLKKDPELNRMFRHDHEAREFLIKELRPRLRGGGGISKRDLVLVVRDLRGKLGDPITRPIGKKVGKELGEYLEPKDAQEQRSRLDEIRTDPRYSIDPQANRRSMESVGYGSTRGSSTSPHSQNINHGDVNGRISEAGTTHPNTSPINPSSNYRSNGERGAGSSLRGAPNNPDRNGDTGGSDHDIGRYRYSGGRSTTPSR